jgi:hypothetical protein
MAVATMTRCDCDCGASSDAPGEQGWWLIDITDTAFVALPWENSECPEIYLHAAGSECVHKLLNAWMEKQREGK